MCDLDFKIGNLNLRGIQGGMGVGVSGAGLASAVANEGWAGIIAAAGLGVLRGEPRKNSDAFRDEIREARFRSNGVIGVNIMRALTDYAEMVRVAVEEGVDLIISGAGLAKDLPKFTKGKDICLLPVVGGVRTASVITKYWKRHGRRPDGFVVEGPRAGGHLAYNHEELVAGTAPGLESIAREVVDFANEFDNPIPVIVAGGVYTGADIARYKEIGVSGVQMATRFVTTKECDAHDNFKQAYIDASGEDIRIIKSPVGMPGRAIWNDFLEDKVGGVNVGVDRCRYKCLATCDPKKSPYCIMDALVNAQKGNLDRGFVFAGSNAYLASEENCKDFDGEFVSVKTLIERIDREFYQALK